MRIFRISNILSLLIATVLGVLLFWTSQAVQQKEEELSAARKKLAQETETVRVLSVEWDYLNRPQRLEELAEELGMKKASAKEVVSNAGDIPEPVAVSNDPRFYAEQGIAQTISMEGTAPQKPAPAAKKTDPIVSPSTAEKQSFERLIETLNRDGDAP